MGRYYVDDRSGCVAVRDCTNTDPDYPGLHPDTRGVIRFWMGTKVVDKCETCGHEKVSGWEVTQETLKLAMELCDRLNAKEKKQS